MQTENELDQDIIRSAPPFEINSAERANWLVRKLVECRQYAARARDFAGREQRRAAREERTLMWLFGRQLEAWTARQIAADGGRRKSISLPAGTVGYRRVAAKLVVDDEAVVLAWAKRQLPEAVVGTERLSKAVLDDVMKTTGVIPPEGAHVAAASEDFYVA